MNRDRQLWEHSDEFDEDEYEIHNLQQKIDDEEYDDEEYKDLVVVLRYASFDTQDDNGFVMFAIHDLHTSPEKLKALKAILHSIFTDSDLELSVIQTADKFAIKSIESNA